MQSPSSSFLRYPALWAGYLTVSLPARLFGLSFLYNLTNQLCRLSCEHPAIFEFIASHIDIDLIEIHPIHIDEITA
jgi:hypothetical protein